MKRAIPILLALGLLLIAAPAVSAEAPAVPEPPPELSPVEPLATLDLSTVECDATAEALLAAGDVTQALPTCGICSYGTNCDGQSWYASCFTGTAWGSCTPFGSTTCTDGRARCRCYENPP